MEKLEVKQTAEVPQAKETAPVKTGIALVPVEHLPMTVEVLRQFTSAVEDEISHFVKGVDFVEVPGVPKPFMAQPGAEKLGRRVRFRCAYDDPEIVPLEGGHREVRIRCRLYSLVTGQPWCEGLAVCSTMESKYRYRDANRKCPVCGKETIFKSKQERGGGWYCWLKRGGCGANFNRDDVRITEQQVGRIENPDLADVYHTVEMMAQKRAYVKAIRTATATSDRFSQDEDLVHSAEQAKPANTYVVEDEDYNPDTDEKATQVQLKAIALLFAQSGMSQDMFVSLLADEYKASSTADLTVQQADDCIERFNRYIAKKQMTQKHKVAGTKEKIEEPAEPDSN
jgi:hypothetical protein